MQIQHFPEIEGVAHGGWGQRGERSPHTPKYLDPSWDSFVCNLLKAKNNQHQRQIGSHYNTLWHLDIDLPPPPISKHHNALQWDPVCRWCWRSVWVYPYNKLNYHGVDRKNIWLNDNEDTWLCKYDSKVFEKFVKENDKIWVKLIYFVTNANKIGIHRKIHSQC